MLSIFSKVSRCCNRNFSIVHLKTKSTNYLKEKLENVTINQLDDWYYIRHEILTTNPYKQINDKNLDALTISVCTGLKKYDLAKSYINYLDNQEIPINLATLGKYLKLFYMKQCVDKSPLTEQEHEEILKIYNRIKQSYKILDPLTVENVIVALSLTKQWRETIDLLRNRNLVNGPSPLCYNVVISAAFRHNESQLAWQLLNEMLENNKIPDSSVYFAYFDRLKQFSQDKDTMTVELEKLLIFLQENNLIFDETTAKALKILLDEFKIDVTTVKTIDRNNTCSNCWNVLKRFDLTNKEFNELKTRILNNVIIGRNIFNKTTPKELEKFQRFITNLEPHHVVIDGLNVAYSIGFRKTPLVLSNVVCTVVTYFVKQNKTILLLGRDHMNKWPSDNWQFIKENTTIFLTDDLSQDDPFLLYCALHCGKDTVIVTKDLMRGHRYLLKDLHYQNLFNRWLTQRQYQLIRINNGRPIFRLPKRFTCIPQKSGVYWHIPYEIPIIDTKEQKIDWLCCKF